MIVFEIEDEKYEELEELLDDMCEDFEKAKKHFKKIKEKARGYEPNDRAAHASHGGYMGQRGSMGERGYEPNGRAAQDGSGMAPMNHLGTGSMGERQGYPGMPMMPMPYYDPYLMDRRYKN